MTDTVLELVEYGTLPVPSGQLPAAAAERLWGHHSKQVHLDPPTVRNGRSWVFRATSWVGYLPLADGVALRLKPKVSIANLFRMLEYAYDLRTFRLLEGSAPVAALEDLFERLVHVLALRVRERCRRGLYRAYLPHRDRLPFLRGRLELSSVLRRPWELAVDCRYQEHTADLEDNRILAWTLHRVARSGACRRDEVRAALRTAARGLRGAVSLDPCTADDCAGRTYHRLNDDYRPLHDLCRFLLEHTGPDHRDGDRRSLPFLLDMNRLYEQFVACWLQRHLPPHLAVRPQRVLPARGVRLIPDLVIEDRATGRPLLVADTKYKAPDASAASDVAQVVTYATALGVRDAFLLYPRPLPRPLDAQVGPIHVRSAVFPLQGDLEAGGRQAVEDLGLQRV